jgi:phenylpropionate dioxygenase-like ring-hydroxylating dioxygenase large terminal subunit
MSMDIEQFRTLAAERYTGREFFRREWDSVWTRSWLLLAHTGELLEPGDFLVEQVGAESILAVRQEDRSIKCFYNMCQHRGNKLVTTDAGSLGTFTCGYHGWRYALDGRCVYAQDAEDFPVNPCEKLRLVELGCEIFGGFIWINMNPSAVDLKSYLGSIWDHWQTYPTDRFRRISATSVRLPCNWKTAMDNFHESYHVAAAHPIGLQYTSGRFRRIAFPPTPPSDLRLLKT